MIRLLFSLLFLICCPAVMSAGGWCRQWISADSVGDSQLWFLRTLILPSQPVEARLEAISGGRVCIYVNGYNATTDILAPYKQGDKVLKSIGCDILPYITDDTCRIAVWYSPFLREIKSKHLSLTVWCRYPDGQRQSYVSDSNWSWVMAPAETNGNDECFNSLAMYDKWNIDELPAPMLLPVRVSSGSYYEPSEPYTPQYIRHIYSCKKISATPMSLTYLSPSPFCGWVRVTLRGMKRGATLSVNGFDYICNGDIDEQACRRFTISPVATDHIEIRCSSGITADNVMSVEAIDID